MKLFIVFPLTLTSLLAQHALVVGGGAGWLWGDEKVLPKMQLPAIATLTGSASSNIILKCGDSMLSYSCAKDGARVPVCATEVPYVKVTRIDPVGWASKPKASLTDIVFDYLARAPGSVENLGVRAGANLTDAVVQQTGDTVLWAPTLVRLMSGSYCFQLDRLPARAALKPMVFKLDWDPEDEHQKTGAAQLPGLAPGTFTLQRGSPGDDGSCHIDDPDAAPAWVVVVSDHAFGTINGEWQSYSADIERLEADTSPEVASTIRHAMLAYLAESAEKQ